MSTMQVSEAEARDDRRQWPRYGLAGRGPFTLTADGRICACTIEDISLGGARLRLDGEIPRNLEIRIEHPLMGSAYAKRCWSGAQGMGVEFDHSQQSLDFITHCLSEGVEPARAEQVV
jgi:hypothetical protein